MKEYRIDMKEFMKQANWEHRDFPIVACFFGKDHGTWTVTEDMLEEIDEVPSALDDALVYASKNERRIVVDYKKDEFTILADD